MNQQQDDILKILLTLTENLVNEHPIHQKNQKIEHPVANKIIENLEKISQNIFSKRNSTNTDLEKLQDVLTSYSQLNFSEKIIDLESPNDLVNALSISINILGEELEDAVAEIQKQKDIAEKSSKMKEEFLANMSHEIRTPMNAIVGLSNLLVKSKNLDEKQTEYIKSININSKNLLSIINDILDYSKIEAGKIDFEQRDFSIKESINYLYLALSGPIFEKGIDFEINTDIKVPEYINGDSVKLTQVLTNLISNATKFTQTGKISLYVGVDRQINNDLNLIFKIKDTGIGIPVEKQKHIFESFAQASSDTTRKYGGTGLGLAIVKKIVELQKGTIELESTVDKGTEFIVTLPFKKASDNATLIQAKNNNTTKLQDIRILLVEDNSFNQMVAIDTIKEENNNIHIETADNGLIAIEKLKKGVFDIILMDIQMPEMDGHMATKKIRNELHLNTPIIAMTAHASSQEIENCYENGMNDYITKPFESEKLFEKIQLAIDKTTNKNKTLSIDFQSLEKFTKGNKERMKKMISLFLNETPDEIKKLRILYSNNNIKDLRILTHSMKPKFEIMGFDELRFLANAIELICIENTNLEEIEQYLSLLEEKAAVVLKKLKKKINNEF